LQRLADTTAVRILKLAQLSPTLRFAPEDHAGAERHREEKDFVPAIAIEVDQKRFAFCRRNAGGQAIRGQERPRRPAPVIQDAA